MAASYAIPTDGHSGKQPSAPNINVLLEATLDASYPTGGYAFDPAALLQALAGYDKAPPVMFVSGEVKGDHVAEFDRAASKLKILLRSTGAEVAGAVDLSVTPGTIRLLIIAQ